MKLIFLLLSFSTLIILSNAANAVTPPTNVVYYVPITFTNFQSNAVAANTQLTFTFNALAYQLYETNTLNNTELFYSNGTVVTSWIEGNTANALTPGNQLYESNNVRFWITSPPTSAFLPADTGTPTTNTIYLGFAGNTPNAANILFNGTVVGEAPQLSTTFGKYDNGNYVFNLYGNFQGSSLPYGWTLQGTAVGNFIGGTSATGGVRLIADSGTNAGSVESNSAFTTQNIIIETSSMYNGNAGDGLSVIFYSSSIGSASTYGACPSVGYCATYGYNFFLAPRIVVNGATGASGSAEPPALADSYLNFLFTQTTVTPSSLNMNFSENGASMFQSAPYVGFANPATYSGAVSNANGILAVTGSEGQDGKSSYEYLYWARARQLPPSGIMPNVTINGAVVSVSPVEQEVQLGGAATLTGSASGGLPPYSYQWLATTVNSGSLTAAQANSICESPQSATCAFATNSLTSSGTYQLELQVTDSASAATTSLPGTVLVNAIVAYVPITLTNNQNIAVAANTQLTFTLNALAYQRYETNTLNNTFLYYQNGTAVNSWIEGNTANALTPGNQLYESGSVRFWIKSPPTNAFLAANTSTATTNTIYLGFTGNTPTPYNILMNGQSTGEAPQLSTTFGKYDNGGYVFNIYGNFQGSSMPAGWGLAASATFVGGTSTTGGVVLITNANITSGSVVSNKQFTTQNIIIETSSMYNGNAGDGLSVIFYSPSIGGPGITGACQSIGYCAAYEYNFFLAPRILVNGAVGASGSAEPPALTDSGLNFLFTQTTVTPSSIKMNFSESTSSMFQSALYSSFTNPATYSGAVSNANGILAVTGSEGQDGKSSYEYLYWVRARQLPQNGIMPNATFGGINNQLYVSILPSSSSLFTGSQLLTAEVVSGIPPYTYQWYEEAPGASSYSAISGATSSTYTFTTGYVSQTSTYGFNVVATDSTSNTATNSPSLITVHALPSFPSNIAYFMPITFENQNSVAVTSNTPLAVGVNALKFNYGNVIGFNALKYNLYYTPTLNNAEFFYQNGTIIPSWLEGNYLNEQDANAAATSSSSPNALINSANILYWVDVNSLGFLPANTGTPTTNIIYLGWLGNVISPANTALSSATGEAPQLSCNLPANTITGCATGQYGEYDNGANVFSFYDNFAGISINAAYNQITPLATTITQNNGIIISTGSGSDYGGIISNNGFTPPFIFDGDIRSASGVAAGIGLQNGNTASSGSIQLTFWSGSVSYGSMSVGLNPKNNPNILITNGVMSGAWYASASQTWYRNYTAFPGTISQYTLPSTEYITSGIFFNSASTLLSLQWQRVRAYPPNGILPYTTYGTVLPVYTSPSTPTLTLSNTLIDQGQSILFTASTSGGTSPYIYNYQITNSITNTLIANMLFTSNSWLWTPSPNLYTSNSFRANVFVTDANPTTVNSVFSNIGYNAASIIALTASNTLLDNGQYVTFTLSDTGGTGPKFNSELYNVTGSSQVQSNVLILSAGGSNIISFQVHSPTNGNVFNYNGMFYDEGTSTSFTNNTIATTITVNAVLTIPSITTPSPSTQINSNTITWITSFSGGTSPYTYNWNVYNTITGAIVTNMLETNSFTGNSFSWTIPGSAIGNTVNANVAITDSASSHVTINSVKSGTLTIISAYTPPTIPSLIMSNTLIDQGQSILFTASFSSGTGPYSYAYNVYAYNSQTSSNQLIANMLFTGNTYTSNSWFWTPNPNLYIGNSIFQANVAITDANPTTVNSVLSSFGYNAAAVIILTASNTLLDDGQYITFTLTDTGGTGSKFNSELYNLTGSSQVQSNVLILSTGGSNTISFQVHSSATNGNVFHYNAIFYDEGTSIPFTNNSTLNTITINSVLTVPSISVSSTAIESGQSTAISSYESGGTKPYTYNFLIFNSIDNSIIANQLGPSNTFSIQSNSLWVTNSPVRANIIITDGASTLSSSNSINSNPITINSVITTPILTASNTPTVKAGQYELLTASLGGGTSPYSYNFIIVNSTTNVLMANQLYTDVSSTTNTFLWLVPNSDAGNSVIANVVVTDGSSNTVNSIGTLFTIHVYQTLLTYTYTNPGSVGYYTIAVVTFNGLPTTNNQSAWSLYVNGKLYGKTNSIISWSEQAQPGIYNFNFTNPGNENYTGNSLDTILTVQTLSTGGGPGSGGSTVSSTTSITVPTTSTTVSSSTTTTIGSVSSTFVVTTANTTTSLVPTTSTTASTTTKCQGNGAKACPSTTTTIPTTTISTSTVISTTTSTTSAPTTTKCQGNGAKACPTTTISANTTTSLVPTTSTTASTTTKCQGNGAKACPSTTTTIPTTTISTSTVISTTTSTTSAPTTTKCQGNGAKACPTTTISANTTTSLVPTTSTTASTTTKCQGNGAKACPTNTTTSQYTTLISLTSSESTTSASSSSTTSITVPTTSTILSTSTTAQSTTTPVIAAPQTSTFTSSTTSTSIQATTTIQVNSTSAQTTSTQPTTSTTIQTTSTTVSSSTTTTIGSVSSTSVISSSTIPTTTISTTIHTTTTTSTTSVSTLPSTTSIPSIPTVNFTLNRTVIYAGGQVLFKASGIDGTPPYSNYVLIIANLSTNNVLAQASMNCISSCASATYVATAQSSWTGSDYAYVLVTDSIDNYGTSGRIEFAVMQIPTTTTTTILSTSTKSTSSSTTTTVGTVSSTSTASTTTTIIPLAIPTPKSTTPVDQGETATINDTGATGGRAPYSYVWLVNTTGLGVLSVTINTSQMCASYVNTLTCTFVTNELTNASHKYNFRLRATDSLGDVVTSNSTALTVNPQLMSIPMPAVVNSIIYVSQNVLVAVDTMPQILGGTPPYAYYWLVSFYKGAYYPATQYQCAYQSGPLAPGQTINCTSTRYTPVGNYTYKVKVIDSSDPVNSTSPNSTQVRVNPELNTTKSTASSSTTSVIPTCPAGSICTTSTTTIITNSTNSTISNSTTILSNSSSGTTIGGSGGSGGGGSSLKTIVTTEPNGCQIITNMSVPNTVSFVINGTTYIVTDSFIAINFTSVIINGATYVLKLDIPVIIKGYPAYMQLLAVSYLPVRNTVVLEECPISKTIITTTSSTTMLTTSTIESTSVISSVSSSTQTTTTIHYVILASTTTKAEYLAILLIVLATLTFLYWRRKKK